MRSSIKKSMPKSQKKRPSPVVQNADRPRVPEPLADVLRQAHEGLLALSVRIGLQTLQKLMASEVDALAGPKGHHNLERTAVRHGVEEGYVYVGDRRVPVTHPRVRAITGEEVPLETYHAFQDPTIVTQAALERMLFGLASRQPHHADPGLTAAFDAVPSKSTVSRRFIRATRQAMETFLARHIALLFQR